MIFMLYSSIANPKIKELKKLQQRKYREKEGLFLVEGSHLVLEAYKTGNLKELLLEQDQVFPLDVPTSYLSRDVLHYLSEVETPQMVLGVCSKRAEQPLGKRILVLDALQDPGNLGTIIRSAVAFHIDTVVLGKGTVDLYNAKVIRASQGMIFHMNFMIADLVTFLPELQQQGYVIYGTKVTHGNSLRTLVIPDSFAVVMGNEGNGIQEEVADLLEQFLYIDMNPVCESLNVGVATSIILYELDK